MFVIKDNIHVNAPIERCFLLSTSIELVAPILGMTAVSGKTSGLVVAGDRLTWRGWKFGLPQRHETLITQYDPPTFFEDTMASGRFRAFRHEHYFTEMDGRTLLKDVVRFSMPFGPLGKIVGKYLMVPHIRSLVQRRFHLLRRIAESEEWRSFLPDPDLP